MYWRVIQKNMKTKKENMHQKKTIMKIEHQNKSLRNISNWVVHKNNFTLIQYSRDIYDRNLRHERGNMFNLCICLTELIFERKWC